MNLIKTTLFAAIGAVSFVMAQDAYAQSSQHYRTFEGDLVDLVPSLYGGDGITLQSAPVHSHAAHFTSQALDRLNELSASLTGLTTPAFNLSPANLFEYDPILEEYVTIETSRNPSFNSEFASTIGKGRTGFGVAVTHRKLSTINGTDLDDIVIDLEHLDVAAPGATLCVGGPPGACHTFELDIVRLNIDINLKETSLLVGVTHGLTDKLEVSVLAPFVDTELAATSVASIVRHQSASNIPFVIHTFDPMPGADQPRDAVRASRSGVGDILLSAKHEIGGDWVPEDLSLALGTDIRLPTGSEENLQGLPHVGIAFKGLMTANWNIDGMEIDTNVNGAYVVNGTGHGGDAVRFAIGSSFEPGLRIRKKEVAFTADVTAWKSLSLPDMPQLQGVQTVLHDHTNHDHAASAASLIPNNDVQFDVALGVHVPVLKKGYMFYEARLPLNEKGLRANITQSIGFQLPF